MLESCSSPPGWKVSSGDESGVYCHGGGEERGDGDEGEW